MISRIMSILPASSNSASLPGISSIVANPPADVGGFAVIAHNIGAY